MARLPSFEGFLNVVYKFLQTDEKELEKVNEVFFEVYTMTADAKKFPPIGMIDRNQYYAGAIFKSMQKLDKEYKKLAQKSLSAPAGVDINPK
jgi:hypothetical protein